MTGRRRNVAASIHARLLKAAQVRSEDFNLTLQRFAAERFLYRLGASRHRERFVLKGATLFALWGGAPYRATRDLDLAGFAEDDAKTIVAIVREIVAVRCDEDGLLFQESTVRTERIRPGSVYRGFRVKLKAALGTAKVNLQLDIGLGDAIEPPPHDVDFPALLDGPPPRIRVYSREAVIAEKTHAMVVLGVVNSRFKDFHDVYMLASRFSFEGRSLSRAIAATFERRKTQIQEPRPAAMGSDFFADAERALAWKRYLARDSLERAPRDFVGIGKRLRAFLAPPWKALVNGSEFARVWRSKGPWRTRPKSPSSVS